MTASGDAEDVVELFECALLRLGHEEEDQEESEYVETGVEAEDTSRCESDKEAREGHG